MPEGASLNLQLEERLYLLTVLDEMVLRCAGVAVSVCGPPSACTQGSQGRPASLVIHQVNMLQTQTQIY